MNYSLDFENEYLKVIDESNINHIIMGIRRGLNEYNLKFSVTSDRIESKEKLLEVIYDINEKYGNIYSILKSIFQNIKYAYDKEYYCIQKEDLDYEKDSIPFDDEQIGQYERQKHFYNYYYGSQSKLECKICGTLLSRKNLKYHMNSKTHFRNYERFLK